MPDTFLARLGYVLNPTMGDPRSFVDRAGTFVAWVITVYDNGAAGKALPAPPEWVPAWVAPILLVLSTLLTAYHMAHPATEAAVTAPPPSPIPMPAPPAR